VAVEIGRACRDLGFFYATGHGIGADTLTALEHSSRRFFALPEARKMEIAMARGGRAWRGYFPVGGELTSGKPDLKQGLYFGEELGEDDARVVAGLPLHGRNLFPEDVPELKPAVLRFMREATDAASRSALVLMHTIFVAPTQPGRHCCFASSTIRPATGRDGASASTPTTAC
jgi:isopenicillin N synthase-like dioxygenase